MSNTTHKAGSPQRVTVYHNGKPVQMWPVDARYALSFPKEYSLTPDVKDPEDTPATTVQDAEPSGTPALQGVVEDPDSVTMDQLREALRNAGESFRGNSSKADLIAQWNALAKASA